MTSRVLKLVLPPVVLVAGLAAAALLASSRSAPPRVEQPVFGPLVEVVEVVARAVAVEVTGHGQVGAQTTITLVPEVAGRVLGVSPSLVAGGFFDAGEPLVVIDPRDYELAVERARAAVARAAVTLEREQAEAGVARHEWDALNPGEEPPSGLVVREPQVRQAEAELEAARAELGVAQLALSRTEISAPFDGVVVSENVDPGQVVGVGTVLATVYAVDRVEVRVPLKDRELAWFDVPRRPGEPGPKAAVRARFAGGEHEWPGRVSRLEVQVDPDSRMVHVVVEVPRPFARENGRPPLLPGTFVEVVIDGRTVEQVVPLPRHAVHPGDTVWVVSADRLEIRPVEVARADREVALVATGLTTGERVVVSSLDAVTNGMTVRVVEPQVAVSVGGAS